MKKVVLIIMALIMCLSSFGQQDNIFDSISKNIKYIQYDIDYRDKKLSEDIKKINQDLYILYIYKNDIIYIQNNLDLSHKEFKSGLKHYLLGTCLTTLGSIIYINSLNQTIGDTEILSYMCWGIGGTVSIIGIYKLIDSHKYIGRCKNKRN